MTPVFVDASALTAMANRSDPHYEAAHDLAGRLRSTRRPWVLTQWILAEFLATCARPPVRALAIEAVERLLDYPLTTIIPAEAQDWRQGFVLYMARPDKAWSLVDCISILVCQRLGITDVFTTDHHFAQAGLNVLLTTRS